MNPADLYLGLISGTSADAIDAALLRFAPPGAAAPLEVLAARALPYPNALRQQILALSQRCHAPVGLDDYGRLDVAVGAAFAAAALALLKHAGVAPEQVRAIGSHGQTVRHGPHGAHPFTLQVGDPNVIAERTGIDVVADFRRRDIAAGGQGAPLVPAFHAAVFGLPQRPRAVLNLGGIANLSILEHGQPVRGWDTGPANALMDAWVQRQLGCACDEGGALAAQAHPDADLLRRLLSDPYFAAPPPKSTGREHFDLDWVRARLQFSAEVAPVLRTLLELTARSVAESLLREAPQVEEVLVCGGGVHNLTLLQRLRELLAPRPVRSTAELGLHPDAVEAAAFAWLAREFLEGRPGSRAEVTGASGARRLGGWYPGR